jgi:hypothetical protein
MLLHDLFALMSLLPTLMIGTVVLWGALRLVRAY